MYLNHLPQTTAPTSHPISPLSLPLSGKELHTAPPTNCYKKELQHPHSTIISNDYQHHLITLDIHPQPPNTTTTPEDNSTQSTFYAPYHPSSNNLFRKLPSKVILYPCTTRPQHWATSSTMDPKQYTIFARNVILEEDPKQSVLKKIAASELPSCSLTNDFLRWLLLCVSLLRNFSWIWFW